MLTRLRVDITNICGCNYEGDGRYRQCRGRPRLHNRLTAFEHPLKCGARVVSRELETQFAKWEGAVSVEVKVPNPSFRYRKSCCPDAFQRTETGIFS